MAANAHSKVGPSSLEIILNCTPSLTLTQEMPSETTSFAEEGSAAHAKAEHKLRRALKMRVGKRPVSDYDTDEMEEFTDNYVDFCMDQYGEAKNECSDALAFVEQRVDLSQYVEGCFGTVDFMAISNKTLFVTDLKYGRGVQKEAKDNPQLMAYSLGALLIAEPLFDVEQVVMTIYQPRLYHVSQHTITVDELMEWANEVLIPKTTQALNGEGEYHAGEHCRFCKARNTCRARAEMFLELTKYDFEDPPLLSMEELSEVLAKAEELSKWASDVLAYATAEAIENGKHFTGYKIVEGRSQRKFDAADDVIAEAAKAAGYSDIYNRSLITLTAFEKLMGKKTFQEVLGEYVIKPAGKLTLVKESDPRQEVTISNNDFND